MFGWIKRAFCFVVLVLIKKEMLNTNEIAIFYISINYKQLMKS